MTDAHPNSREQQRLETRRRILEAAIDSFAERGFHGASIREIAGRCEVTQGLVTYHFGSKDNLWREAANALFGGIPVELRARIAEMSPGDPRALARALVKAYVLTMSARPQVMQLLTREGAVDSPRMRWLIENHISGMHQAFAGVMSMAGVTEEVMPAGHLYYVMAGAGSLMFAVPFTCRQISGLDPTDPAVVERHAEYVARLLVPDRSPPERSL